MMMRHENEYICLMLSYILAANPATSTDNERIMQTFVADNQISENLQREVQHIFTGEAGNTFLETLLQEIKLLPMIIRERILFLTVIITQTGINIEPPEEKIFLKYVETVGLTVSRYLSVKNTGLIGEGHYSDRGSGLLALFQDLEPELQKLISGLKYLRDTKKRNLNLSAN